MQYSNLIWLALVALLLSSSVLAQDDSSSSSSSTGDFDSSSTGADNNSTSESSSSSSTGSVSSSSSSTGSAPIIEPTTSGCAKGSLITTLTDANDGTGSHYVCGCIATTNVTDPVTNITTSTDAYYYNSGLEWDGNAELSTNTYTWWDNTVAANNTPFNYIDSLMNNARVYASSSDYKYIRPYPNCYGGEPAYSTLAAAAAAASPPLPYPVSRNGQSSNCLQQIDIQNHGGSASGTSGQWFCENVADSSVQFKRGDQSPPICVVYGGGNRLYKMRFYPVVDQFAQLNIQDSFNSTTGLTQLGHYGTTFQVELNGAQTPYRHRYGQSSTSQCVEDTTNPSAPCTQLTTTSCLVVPYHTLVITLDQGSITKMEWDDDDSLCSNDESVDGNCGQPVANCGGSSSYGTANTDTDTDCNFKIYVSWTGTDSNGLFLSSSQRRISQFRKWSLHSLYNQASDISLSTSLPTIPSNGNDL